MELIGRVLGGRYRIVRSIGAGGMGGVFEAIQEGLGRRVAVKVISEELADEPMYLERFQREAMAAAQLGHPNLVHVTDFQHTPGEPPFLVMELLEGEPLDRRLQRGPLEPALGVDVTLQILAGLEAAHGRGIVHRDLKPANVFLVPMGGARVLAKVLDFGIAKLMDSATYERLTQTGMLLGTPRYATPEQMMDSKAVDARTDVYATGTLLYCMLAGRAPHRSSGAQLLVDIQNREPTDPRIAVPEVSPGLVAVLRRAMQKAPDHRFQSARDFADALAPFAGAPATDPGIVTPRAPPTSGVRIPSAPAQTAAPAAQEPTWRPRSRDAPPTRPTRLEKAPQALRAQPARPAEPNPSQPNPSQPIAAATPSQPMAAATPAHPIAAATPSHPTPALTRPQPTHTAELGTRGGVALGIALFVALTLALLVALGIAIWMGWKSSNAIGAATSGSTGSASDAVQQCRDWETIACGCSDPTVVSTHCAEARARNLAIARGEGTTAGCQAWMDGFRSVCVAGPPTVAAQPRSATGIRECDELARFACSCGPAGPRREARCRTTNEFITSSVLHSESPPGSVCSERRALVDRQCREDP